MFGSAGSLYLRCVTRTSHCSGFSWCGSWAVGCAGFIVVSYELNSGSPQPWCTGSVAAGRGSVALLHVGSSQTRDWTPVCLLHCRQILYCWATRESPCLLLFDWRIVFFKKIWFSWLGRREWLWSSERQLLDSQITSIWK